MIREYKKSYLNINKDNKKFYKDILEFGQEQLVEAKVISETEENIEIEYSDQEAGYTSLAEVKKWSIQEKYRIVYKIIDTVEAINEHIEVKVAPENIIVSSNLDVKFIERRYTDEILNRLEDYLTILIYLFDDMEYEKLEKLDRDILAKNKYTEDFYEIQTIEEFKELLNENIAETIDVQNEEKLIVDKKKYTRLNNSRKIRLVIYAIMIIVIIYAMFFKIPLLKKELKVSDLYQQNKYSEVVETTQRINIKFLDNNIKYDIAVSVIKTEPITEVDKENLLANLTLNTDSEVFDYWIYIGQGEYEKARFKAQNLGDLNMEEYALINQLEMVDLLNESDEEKSALKAQYEGEIQSVRDEKEKINEEENADSAI